MTHDPFGHLYRDWLGEFGPDGVPKEEMMPHECKVVVIVDPHDSDFFHIYTRWPSKEGDKEKLGFMWTTYVENFSDMFGDLLRERVEESGRAVVNITAEEA